MTQNPASSAPTLFPTDNQPAVDASKVDALKRDYETTGIKLDTEAAGPGRPRSERKSRKQLEAELEAAQKVEVSASMFREMAVAAAGIVADRMPSPKPLKPFEEKLFGDSVEGLIKKYFENSVQWQYEVGLGFSILLIVIARLEHPKKSAEIISIRKDEPTT
jgi:hypothetical protein